MYPLSYLFGLNKFRDGAWYEPSLADRIDWALDLLQLKSTDRAVDIGSGDGRVVVAMAKSGATATGIETDPKLVKISTQNLITAGLTDRARIIDKPMLAQSYQSYTKVYIYQFKTVMESLEQKLLTELPSGARVVTNYWQFPHWPISAQIEDVRLYLK